MRCDKLVLENYGSYQGSHELPLADQGLVYILGDNRDEPRMNSNGAGKSSGTCEALEWCCFGVVPKGDHVDSIVNEAEGKNTSVTAYWSDGPNYGLVIKRFRKQGGKTHGVQVWVNGEEKTTLDGAETQRLIERELGLDHQVFRAAVVFGQGDRFLFADAGDKDRLAVCTKIFQMEEIDTWLETAKGLREQTKPLVEGWQRELTTRQARLDEHAALQAKVQEQADAWEQEKARVLRAFEVNLQGRAESVEGMRRNLAAAEAALAALPAADSEPPPEPPEIAAARARKVEVAERWSAASYAQVPKPPELAVLAAERQDLEREQANLRADWRVAGEKRAEYLAAAERYRQLGVGTCSTCGQDVTQEHLDREIQKLDEQATFYQGLQAGHESNGKALEAQLQDVCRRVLEAEQAHQAAVAEQQRKAADLHAELSRAENEVRTLESQYREAVADHRHRLAQRQSAQAEVERLQGYLAQSEQETRRMEADREAKAAEVCPFVVQDDGAVADLRAAVVEAEGHVAQGEHRLKLIQFWIDACGPSGIKNYVLDTRLHELTQAANQGVMAMTGGTHWVQLDTVTAGRTTKTARNKINVRVFKYNPDGSVVERGYRSYSGGERQRVSLGIDFGLAGLIAHRARKQYEVLFLDELFRHLDQAGKEAVVDLLHQLRQTKGSVFVIEHDNEFRQHFDREVLVIKEGGRSRFVLEGSNGTSGANPEAQPASAQGDSDLPAPGPVPGPEATGEARAP